MKKKLFAAFGVVILTLLCSLSVFAAETDDSGMWEYQTYETGVELTKYNGTQTDVYVPNRITKGDAEYSVLKLGDNLFKGNTALNSATLSEGITEIGASSFEVATNLVCIVTPESLTTIGTKAFSGCINFNSIILYETVVNIADDAFSECTKLKIYGEDNGSIEAYSGRIGIKFIPLSEETEPEIYVIAGVKYYIRNGEAEIIDVNQSSTIVDFVIPSNVNGYPVKGIGTKFRAHQTMKSITLPNTITEIPAWAFYNCPYLRTVNLPDSITLVGEYAFRDCTALESIKIPKGVTVIEDSTFYNCARMTKVELPEGIKSIGSNAFYYCINLEDINFPKGLEIIKREAFDSCYKLKEAELPEGLTTLETYAFGTCRALNKVKIPSTLIAIDSSAFYSCNSLKYVEISEGTTSFSHKIFESVNVKYAKLPRSLESISDSAFGIGTAICGYAGTYAEKWATSSGRIFILIKNDNEPEIYTENGLTYCIGSEGAYVISAYSSLTDVVIPDTIKERPVLGLMATFKNNTRLKSIVLSDNITSLAENEFYNCTALESIELPSKLTNIGAYAFHGCNTLKEIVLPQTVTSIGTCAFEYCSSLESFVYPESIKIIADGAFNGCISLKNIEFADDLEVIGWYSFKGCTSLTEIELPSTLKKISSEAFCNTGLVDVKIPDGITEIEDRAFTKCKNLKNVELPESITIIRQAAFTECPSLAFLKIPKSVYNIQYADTFSDTTILLVCKNSFAHNFAKNNGYTFYEIGDENDDPEIYEIDGITYLIENSKAIAVFSAPALTEVEIPASVNDYPVTELRNTFINNTSITSVKIPGSVTTIGENAFYGCRSMTTFEMPDSVESIDEKAFGACAALESIKLSNKLTTIGIRAFSGCKSLTKIEIPDSVLNIGIGAFSSCDALSEVKLSNSLETISNSAFSACGSLKSIDIPEGITEIGDSAFLACTALEEITLPNSLTNIGNSAFKQCCSLKSIEIPGSIKSISKEAFRECTNLFEVKLSDGIETIKEYAFFKCAVTGIEIPESITTIGEFAFSGNPIYFLEIPSTVTKLYSHSFTPEIIVMYENSYATEIYKGARHFVISPSDTYEIYKQDDLVYFIKNNNEVILVDYISDLTNVVVPGTVKGLPVSDTIEAFSGKRVKDVVFSEGVKRIGERTFYDAQFANIVIPNTVTSIGKNAIRRYNHASWQIEIPDSVTVIEAGAFAGNEGLWKVKLSENLTTIGESAFAGCSDLKTINIPETVTSIGDRAFYGCTGLSTIRVPAGVKQLFTSSFADTFMIVDENSYAHNFAVENNLYYFVLKNTKNPEIAYGTGLSGTVTYTDGSVAAGATVDILYDDGTLKESVVTDESGVYNFTYAEVGRYTIRVTDDNGNTASEVVSVKRMNVFDVYLAGETELVLKKGYNVSGAVLPDVARITISDTIGNIIKSIDTSNGVFTFSDIPKGTYIIKAENENGSATAEIYVSNEDINDICLEIKAQSATITGDIKVENRNGTYTVKIWVKVDLIDSDGNVLARTLTNANGKYTFENIPAGSYNIVATTNEIRPDIIGGFGKSHELKGYGHIDMVEPGEYTLDTIILREEKVNLTAISGKVTANGSTQDCQVILTNENGDQIAVFVTDKNGKYNFVNIPDGMYCITAITKVDGMGFTVITVENGVIYGDTDIKVAKADKISKREPTLLAVPNCNTKEEALLYKEVVLAEKKFYDSLSEKERKQLSEEWKEKLFKLVALISGGNVQATEGVTVENIGSVIASDELDKTITFTLNVTETEALEAGEDGITSEEEYETEKMKDKKGKNKKIAKYYDITFSKDGKNISNIQKQTETNGKLRITMEIPQEYRGHKHYSFIHMHNGEAVTLVDLDDDPDTVTFEIDKFSTFALAYSDVELIGEVEETAEYPASVSYNDQTGKLSVTSTEAGTLYVATYSGNKLTNVETHIVPVGTTNDICTFSSNQVALVWNGNSKPLCEVFTAGN